MVCVAWKKGVQAAEEAGVRLIFFFSSPEWEENEKEKKEGLSIQVKAAVM